MPVPIFVIYELLIRIHQLDPCTGEYVSHKFNTSGAVVITTTRTLRIRKALLNKQFKDPRLITETDLLLLTKAA